MVDIGIWHYDFKILLSSTKVGKNLILLRGVKTVTFSIFLNKWFHNNHEFSILLKVVVAGGGNSSQRDCFRLEGTELLLPLNFLLKHNAYTKHNAQQHAQVLRLQLEECHKWAHRVTSKNWNTTPFSSLLPDHSQLS